MQLFTNGSVYFSFIIDWDLGGGLHAWKEVDECVVVHVSCSSDQHSIPTIVLPLLITIIFLLGVLGQCFVICHNLSNL